MTRWLFLFIATTALAGCGSSMENKSDEGGHTTLATSKSQPQIDDPLGELKNSFYPEDFGSVPSNSTAWYEVEFSNVRYVVNMPAKESEGRTYGTISCSYRYYSGATFESKQLKHEGDLELTYFFEGGEWRPAPNSLELKSKETGWRSLTVKTDFKSGALWPDFFTEKVIERFCTPKRK